MKIYHTLILSILSCVLILGGCSCSEKRGAIEAECPRCGYLMIVATCDNCGASRMYQYNGAAAFCSKCGGDHFTTLTCPKCKTRTTNLKVK